jgi:hypothetical protein
MHIHAKRAALSPLIQPPGHTDTKVEGRYRLIQYADTTLGILVMFAIINVAIAIEETIAGMAAQGLRTNAACSRSIFNLNITGGRQQKKH